MDFTLLKKLTDTPGMPGDEKAIRELAAEQLADLGAQIRTDPMGNLIAHVPGQGPKVLLIAHMDEVGLMVSKIEPEGFLRVMNIGGIDPYVLYGQPVIVHGLEKVKGAVGTEPPHLKRDHKKSNSRDLSVDDFFIDLGLPPEKVNELVHVGDMVSFETESWETETSFFGKALDDRVGLFVMIEALRAANQISCDLYLAGSVQEECGLRGAAPAAFSVRPQIAVALEGTFAVDVPGAAAPANLIKTSLGKGPEIRMTDKAMISDRELVRFARDVAEKNDIPHQVIVKMAGMTDAAPIQKTAEGVKVTTVSVPVRYIHAPVSVADKSDIRNAVRLMAALIGEISRFDLD